MEYQWKIKNAGGGDIITRLLQNRGITTEFEIASFLNPDWDRDTYDPMLFRQMSAAVERIFRALEIGEKILIHGDYDADGVCGSALLYTALRDICRKLNFSFNVSVYLPDREHDGYGVAMHNIERFVQEKVNLLITVDCGIANAPELERAQEHDIDSIICDHHQLAPELPKSSIIIHPLAPGEEYPNKNLSGTGVVFKLASILIQAAKDRGADFPDGYERWFLDFVAIATVTDVMRLMGENRALEKYGLMVLNKTRRPGIKKIIEFSGTQFGSIDTEAIGFRIGPRLNAAGRIRSADLAFRTLISESEDEAIHLASDLEIINRERQRISNLAYEEAKITAHESHANAHVLVVYNETWHPGIIGLVAGKLASEFGRPAFALTAVGEHFIGSGRSVGGFHLVEAMRFCGDIFIKSGGHPQACGLTLASLEMIKVFDEKLQQFAYEFFGNDRPKPILEIETEIDVDEISLDLYYQLKKLEPFGQGNPRPIFISRMAQIISVQAVGAEKSHLRLTIASEKGNVRQGIGFGLGAWAGKLLPGQLIDIVFELSVNEWNGSIDIQCRILDLKPSK